MTSLLTHLECTRCGRVLAADRLQTVCPTDGGVLYARYDLGRAARELDRDEVARRPHGLWRLPELMPVQDPSNIVTLGEGSSPLLPLRRVGERLGLPRLWAKDESLNPTGSFKARGLSAAVSRAKELGATRLSIPTAGNAGSALAAYGARAGMPVDVYMPGDTPTLFKVEAQAYGATVHEVDGLIDLAGALAGSRAADTGGFAVATLKEPYRVEGKKTMGYELAQAFQWRLPDVIIYPTGGGVGLLGMWKGFAELEALGWIGPERPRMVCVQSEGCAPLVRAWEEGAERAARWDGASTYASGIRVPQAIGDYLALRILRESGGIALAVTDGEMAAHALMLGALEGVFAAPEGGATLAALRRLRESGDVGPEDRVVLFNTGTGLKYPVGPENEA
jgi:threonine synthase